MTQKTGKEIIDAIQAAVRGKISHVSVAGQEWVRMWDAKVQVPAGTCILGPNTANGERSEYNPSLYGCSFDDPSKAARIVLWFKSWDEATQFHQSIIIESGSDGPTT